MEGLVPGGQRDYAAGIVRGVARALIPENGLYDCVNGLFDDDGSNYRRGGVTWHDDGDFGAESLTWIWDGYLAAGHRTVVATPSDFYAEDHDDHSIASLGGTGLDRPATSAVLGGVLFIGGGAMYAGSMMAADVSTGTVSLTSGSATVTGAGTSWSSTVDAGALIRFAGAGRYYVVKSVASNTSLELVDPFDGATASGVAYVASRMGSAAAHGAPVADIYVAAANRLFALDGDTVRFSNGISSTGVIRSHVFGAHDYHKVPDGAQCIAGAELGGSLLVFTTAGLYRIGNVAYNLVDASGQVQQTLNRVTGELVAWGATGISTWQGALVVAATDGVYLVDGVSPPQPVSRSVRPIVNALARDGHAPGGMVVFQSHLLMPVLDASGAPAEMLVCRLDRAVETRFGVIFPWSRLEGFGARLTALAVHVHGGAERLPVLLGASADVARIVDVDPVFTPGEDTAADADGSVHRWMVETRDFATGGNVENLVRRMRALLQILGAATVQAYVSVGRINEGVTEWGLFDWGDADWYDAVLAEFQLLEGNAPASDGRDPYAWEVIKHARHVRFRLQSSDPATSIVLRDIEFMIRLSRSN